MRCWGKEMCVRGDGGGKGEKCRMEEYRMCKVCSCVVKEGSVQQGQTTMRTQ